MSVALVRGIGRAAMTGLVVNIIIGSSIFGLPGELQRLLGRASPLVMLAGALCIAVFAACAAELAAQFPEAGGSYLLCAALSAVLPASLWPGSGCSPV